MLGIQIVGILFALFMIYYSFLNYKKKEFKKIEFGGWLVLWSGLIFLTLYPHSVSFLVENILSMQRPLDFFIVSGFLFLIALSFYNYNLARKNNRRLEKIVQEIAFRKAEEVPENIKKEESRIK